MKKSKFLKKSLSLLLVVLLAVAMVPFGASAADANPTLAELRVGAEGALATIDHNTKKIDVVINPGNNLSSINLSYVAQDGVGKLYIGSGLDEVLTSPVTYDLTSYKDATNNAVVPLRLVDPDNSAFYTDYTLTIQNEELSNNVLISDFDIPGKLSSTFAVGKTSFEVLMPYDTDLSPTAVAQWNIGVKLADSRSDWEFSLLSGFEPGAGNTGDYDQFFDIIVTAPSNETQTYRVYVRRAEAITSFDFAGSVEADIKWPDQIGSNPVGSGTAASGSTVGTTNDDGVIVVTIPKHARTDLDYLKNVIPEFTSEVNPTRVRIIDNTAGTTTTLTSGVTAIDLSNAYVATVGGATPRVYVEASYPAGGATAVYALFVTEEAQGSRAIIEGLTVSSAAVPNYQVAGVIDGTDINVTVANSMDLSKMLLTLKVPEGAEYTFTVGSNNYTSGTYNVPGSPNMPVTAEYVSLSARSTTALGTIAEIDLRNKVTITVKSETNVTKTYTLNVTTAATQDVKAKFNSMYLKNNDTGETYTADAELLKGVEVVFTIPSSLSQADLQNFTLYYSAPLGVSLEYLNGGVYDVLPASSTKLRSAHIGTLVPTPNHATPNVKTDIKVTAYNSFTNALVTTNYKVSFKYEDWKSGGTFTKFSATTARDKSEVSSDNTYSGAISSVTRVAPTTFVADAPAGTKVSALTVTVPYVMYEKWQHLTDEYLSHTYLADLEIPDRSSVYIQLEGSSIARKVYTINDGKWNRTNDVIYDIKAAGMYNPDPTANNNAVRIFIFSEKAAFDYDGNGGTAGQVNLSAAILGDANVTTHYLVVKPAAPKTTANLSAVTMVNEKGQKVDAVVTGTSITFNVPYSWANGTEEIHLEYTSAPGNQLVYRTVVDDIIPSVSGGWKQLNGTYYAPADGDAYIIFNDDTSIDVMGPDGSGSTISGQLKSIQAISETDSIREYELFVNINPIETGAAIESFSVNGVAGTISGNTINVVLPYASKFNNVAPVFTASKMATVTFGTSDKEVISGVTEIDFTDEVVLKVTSEDDNYVNNYTVKVTAPLGFSDVTGGWYYKWVMEAAELGIISGYGDGTFRPHNAVTRGEFMSMLTRAYGVSDAELATYTNNPFLDVEIDRFYGQAIAWAVDKGFVSGYTDSTFKPNANITRQEMASIFARVKGLTQVTDPTTKYTDDGSIATWAKGYVYACQADGIMTGNVDGTFAPGKTATRAETASAIVRYYHNK